MQNVLTIHCRNPDLNRKTYEEVTGILKSTQSLQVLRVDVNPEFGLPELTAEVGAFIPMLRGMSPSDDTETGNVLVACQYENRGIHAVQYVLCRCGGFYEQPYPIQCTSGLARHG